MTGIGGIEETFEIVMGQVSSGRIIISGKFCPKMGSCSYLAHQLDAGITPEDARDYQTLICEVYHPSCELNRDSGDN